MTVNDDNCNDVRDDDVKKMMEIMVIIIVFV